MKTCQNCKTEFPLDCFYAERRRPNGRRPYCKACDLAKSKAYQAANVEKMADQRQAYRAKNAPVLAEKRAQYRAAHLEAERERRRQNYALNKAAELARNAAYRQANAPSVLARKRDRQREYVAERPNEVAAKKKTYFKDGRENLKDWFVLKLIRARTNLNQHDVPPALVELKREQITMRRMALQLKKALHERITDFDRIPGQPSPGDDTGRPPPDRGQQLAGSGAEGNQRHGRGSDGEGAGLDQQQPER